MWDEDKWLFVVAVGGLGVFWIVKSVEIAPAAFAAGQWRLGAGAVAAGLVGLFLCGLCILPFVPKTERGVYGGAKFEKDIEEARRGGLREQG